MAPIPEGTKRSTFLSVLLFSFPLALTGILQILFNTADMIIVGRFAGSSALAAVGTTSSLVHLLVGTFVGTSVGANIHAARCLGANDLEKLRRGVSTAVILSALMGIFVMLLGQTAAKAILVRMGTPADILEDAARYLRIYFWGAPALLIYNFSAALLRANGDTRHSLYFLVIAGVLNVTLNLLFVTVAKLGVAGVAYAEFSVSGNGVHCYGKVDLKKLHIHLDKSGKPRMDKQFYLKNPHNVPEKCSIILGGFDCLNDSR